MSASHSSAFHKEISIKIVCHTHITSREGREKKIMQAKSRGRKFSQHVHVSKEILFLSLELFIPRRWAWWWGRRKFMDTFQSICLWFHFYLCFSLFYLCTVGIIKYFNFHQKKIFFWFSKLESSTHLSFNPPFDFQVLTQIFEQKINKTLN